MATNTVVGMMDSAYFVGRKVILDWLNDLCQLNLAKIEETASGAVACQVMDALFPGQVPMQKVNWGAKVDYEFIQNYKVLQGVFRKLKVDKKIEVDRLVRARYQDNLEFMQWLKKFSEVNQHQDIDEYDAIAARNKGKGVKMFKPAQASKKGAKKPTRTASLKENKSQLNKSASTPSVGPVVDKTKSLDAKVRELTKAKAEVEEELVGLERERDFYFNKLREVEIILQNYVGADEGLIRNVLKVLYATDDDVDGEAAYAAADAAIKASKEARKAKELKEATTEGEDTAAVQEEDVVVREETAEFKDANEGIPIAAE